MSEIPTNIVLDEDLVAEAQRMTRLSTKREVVHFALQELVRQHRRAQINIRDLTGQIDFSEDYDPQTGWDRSL